NVVLEPGSRIVAKGVTGTFGQGGGITIESSGVIGIQSMGTSRSRIEANGAYEAGGIELFAAGSISINGTVSANTSSLDGFGGFIDIDSANGTVSLSGAGLQAIGGNRGENGASGGEITIAASGNV